MRAALFLLTATALGAASCAAPPPSRQASAAPQPKDPNCRLEAHNGRFRPGENVPMFMSVGNAGHWCFASLGFSGTAPQGSRIVDQPSHGELRLLVRSSGIVFGYRPKRDYTGSDSFLITMPSGIGGYEMNVPVTVEVHPKA